MRRHWALLAAAAACFTAGGWAYSLTQHLPFTTGLYWAVETATTVGYGDVTPHNPAGRVVSLAVMLTTIPLLAALFAWVTSLHAVRLHSRSSTARDAAAARRIMADLYRHHTGEDHPDAHPRKDTA